MSYDPARPRHVLPFDGKDYVLFGTMAAIEAVEASLREGILQITTRVVGMGATDTSKLVAGLLSANGHDMDQRRAADAIYRMGISSQAFIGLQIHLSCFLRVALEPPELREEMSRRMGEIVGKLTTPEASPGEDTKSSASAT